MKKYIIVMLAVLMLLQGCAFKEDKNSTPLSQDTIPETYESSSEISVVSSDLYVIDEMQLETIKEAVRNNEYPYFKDTVSGEIKENSIYRCFWNTKYRTSGPDPATLDISAAYPGRNIQYKTESDTENCIPVLSVYVYVNGRSCNLIAEYSEYYEELFQDLSAEEAESRINNEDRTLITQEMLDNARIIHVYDKNISDDVPEHDNVCTLGYTSLSFKSVKEFKDSVTKGELKSWQKEVIATAFPKDGDKVLTCDFDHLLVPVMPDDIQIDSVGWSGESYSFSFIIPDGAFGIMYVYPENQFDRVYSSRYEDFFKNDLIHINQTKQKDDGKTKTYYSTSAGNFMQVRYSLTGEHKTVVVDKTYRLYMNYLSLKCSDTVPSEVRLYFFEDGVKYIYNLYELDEDITDDFIVNLGIKEYAE